MVPLTDHSRFSSRFALPLAWDLLDGPPAPQHRAAADQANASVLAFLLQGVDIDAGPRPADEELAEALAPLRIKLDMIIDLLARLSYRDVALPPRREVALTASRIAWGSPLPLRAGDWLRIALHFHQTFREPIILFAKVASATAGGPGADIWIEADLAEMPEPVYSDLARLTFLFQRRQRAQRGS
ncbi:MAG TPA: hypothetical protein VJ770_26220 [Stellaceae bacterium]|nr:hypothetical protein [Stellaceae bacterium]